MSLHRDFYCRVPARLIKDESVSAEAKLLYVVLAAHADARTGRTFVGLCRIERLMRCGTRVRRRAQSELVRRGWVRLERKQFARGRLGPTVFVVGEPEAASGPFEHRGETAPYIRHHSQVSPAPYVSSLS